MKKLLLLFTLLGGFVSSFAQLTCASATPITTNGTITAPAVTGTYSNQCYNNTTASAGGAINAIWYSYTATSTGEVTISSNLPANVAPNSVDTRISVFTGTCGALVCYDGNDDVSTTNYLSSITFPVASGTTYYIAWDNYWDANGFQFDFTFTANTCVKPYYINAITNLTTNTATLNWVNSVSNPSSYDVEYGLTGFVQGSGTVVNNITTNSLPLTNLTVGGVYDYYIRSNCGATQSTWTAVNTFALPVACPYSSGLDNATQLAGWTITGATSLSATSANAQSTPNYVFINSTTTAATNASLNSRALYLQANEQVTVTFYTRLGSAAGTPHIMKVWASTSTSTTGATQLGADITVNTGVYTLQTRTFSAPSTGNYYFIFNDVTPIVTAATSLRMDTFSFTSVLSNNEFLVSNLSVYPNPTKNIINISNSLNAVVDNVVLTDLNGRVVKSQRINATEGLVDISDLATGIYMMNITTDQGSATKKVIKE